MRIYNMKSIALILVSLCLIIFSVLLRAADDTSGADFQKIPMVGRTSGMGDSISAVISDVEAINVNPAGLARLEMLQLFYEHSEWFQSVRYEAVSLGLPFKRLMPKSSFPAVLGFNVRMLYYAPTTVYSSWGDSTGEVKFNAFQFKAAYSMSFIRNDLLTLFGGANVSVISKSMDTTAGSQGFAKPALDAGFLAVIDHNIPSAGFKKVFGPTFNAALTFNNIGFVKTDVNENLPFTAKLGLGFNLFDTANLNIDMMQDTSSSFKANLGAEYWFKNLIAARLGVRLGVDQLNHFTWGLGVKQKFQKYMLEVDYAMLPFTAVGLTHKMSLKMGLEKIEIKVPDRTDLLYYKGIDFFVHNDYERAIEMWQRVLKKTPNHKDAKERIAETEALMKREEKQKGLGKVESEFDRMQQEVREEAAE